MNPTEKEIQASILEYLNYQGHFVWRNNSATFFPQIRGKTYRVQAGFKGSADIIGIAKDGRFIAIEVKRKGGKPTLEQTQFIQEISSRGGHALVAESLEQVADFMAIELEPLNK